MTDDVAQIAEVLRPMVSRLYLTLRRNTPITEYSAAQASALTTLLDHGPMRMGELADRESIRMPTATALVDGLAKNNLVERRPDLADRRAVVVTLTDRGRQVLARVGTERDVALRTALTQLTDNERDALAAAGPALHALHRQLENLKHPSPAR